MVEAEKVAKYYHPVLRMDGQEVTVGESERGDSCGIGVDRTLHRLRSWCRRRRQAVVS